MDVSKSGGRVTDMQNRASVPSLVTAGTALLGTVLASTVLLAAGCASTPAAMEPCRRRGRVIRQLGLPPPKAS